MGKIFGISDVRIKLFEPVWEPMRVPAPYRPELPRKILGESYMKADIYVVQNSAVNKGFFKKIINGFRKVV